MLSFCWKIQLHTKTLTNNNVGAVHGVIVSFWGVLSKLPCFLLALFVEALWLRFTLRLTLTLRLRLTLTLRLRLTLTLRLRLTLTLRLRLTLALRLRLTFSFWLWFCL